MAGAQYPYLLRWQVRAALEQMLSVACTIGAPAPQPFEVFELDTFDVPASPDELWSEPATVLNAVAAGKLPGRVAMQRLDALPESGALPPTAHGTVLAALEQPF